MPALLLIVHQHCWLVIVEIIFVIFQKVRLPFLSGKKRWYRFSPVGGIIPFRCYNFDLLQASFATIPVWVTVNLALLF